MGALVAALTATSFAAAGIVAITGGEWIMLLAAVAGTGGVGALVSAVVAGRRLKAEMPVTMRTVAAEEAEAAVRVMAASIDRLEREVLVVHDRAARCEQRWREHSAKCPTAGM